MRFPREARQPLGIMRKGLGQNFYGDFTIQLCIRRAIHDTHAALAELFEDPVVGDRLAYHDRCRPAPPIIA